MSENDNLRNADGKAPLANEKIGEIKGEKTTPDPNITKDDATEMPEKFPVVEEEAVLPESATDTPDASVSSEEASEASIMDKNSDAHQDDMKEQPIAPTEETADIEAKELVELPEDAIEVSESTETSEEVKLPVSESEAAVAQASNVLNTQEDGVLEEASAKVIDLGQEEPKTENPELAVAISEEKKNKKEEQHVEEIDAENAEDAEDESNTERHSVESKDYESMGMEQLVLELESLLKSHKVQNIKSQVSDIKSEFNAKFDALLDEKKDAFISDGGNEIDFYYSSPLKKRFNSVFKDYRNQLNAYHKERESNLKSNLDNRLRIIEDIKNLINVEENINTTYKQFKDLQEEWRNAGPIPRDRYNNAWNSYHHHVEIFYDFLHLNRDLRDMDFKHNLDQKLIIIEQAEALAKEDNVNRAFRELQALHKLWKEDLGPVAKEHREDIWERFSTATKTIHDKRQAYYADLDKAHEKNLERKEEIISKIAAIAEDKASKHQGWQKKIKEVEALRDAFFNAGKVPKRVNEETWSKFKAAVRTFNRQKNAWYKNLKKDQYDNLQKKLELIKIAEEHKDSEDFDATTPLMKRIQSDWKKIGHVPRKDSDKIWKRFKKACNDYFNRINAERDAANAELMEAFEKKQILLDSLKELKLEGDHKKDIETIKSKIAEWKAIGAVPSNKRFIEGKFNKTMDGLFGKLDMDKSKLEMIKFENKLEQLSSTGDDNRLLDNEQNFIKKRIDEAKSNINQFENNLQFFSNVDEKNPLVRDVLKNIEKQKDELAVWEKKLGKLKGMY